MKQRSLYLKKLIDLKDTAELIKVITGVRRCGKSTLLQIFYDFLVENSVKRENIININFESLEFSHIKTSHDLNKLILELRSSSRKTYLLLDEV